MLFFFFNFCFSLKSKLEPRIRFNIKMIKVKQYIDIHHRQTDILNYYDKQQFVMLLSEIVSELVKDRQAH